MPIAVVQVSEILSGMNEILRSACMTEMRTELAVVVLFTFIQCIEYSQTVQ